MTVDEIKWSLVRDAIKAVLFIELPDSINDLEANPLAGDLEANALAGVMAERAASAARLAVKRQKRGKEQACPPGTTA